MDPLPRKVGAFREPGRHCGVNVPPACTRLKSAGAVVTKVRGGGIAKSAGAAIWKVRRAATAFFRLGYDVPQNFDCGFLQQLTLFVKAAEKRLSTCRTSSIANGIRNYMSSPSEGHGSATQLDLLEARGSSSTPSTGRLLCTGLVRPLPLGTVLVTPGGYYRDSFRRSSVPTSSVLIETVFGYHRRRQARF